jgi:hypothetical protein
MRPKEVTAIEMAFPADISRLMLPYDESWLDTREGRRWVDLTGRWMSPPGLGKESRFLIKDGIDPEKALRHLYCIVSSCEPKHEHKIYSVAKLASEWFHCIILEDGTVFGTVPEGVKIDG